MQYYSIVTKTQQDQGVGAVERQSARTGAERELSGGFNQERNISFLRTLKTLIWRGDDTNFRRCKHRALKSHREGLKNI